MKNSKKNINKSSMKNITLLFGIILLFLLIILLLGRLLFHYAFGMKFSWIDFWDSLMSSVLGIILPLLLFNVFYEYFVRIYSSNEISEKITETIMSKREVIDSFEENIRKQFIKTTLQSILQEEKGDVVYDMVHPYLQSKINLRKEYKYTVILEEINGNVGKTSWNSTFSSKDYHLIRESLSYTKVFTDDTKTLPEYICAGFFTDESILDKYFKNRVFFFRENLLIDEKDLSVIKEGKREFISEFMKLKAFINEIPLTVDVVDANDSGIVVSFKTPPNIKMDSVKYDISFIMPQLKSKNSFMAVIHEPTFSPKIRFIYPKDSIKLTTIPFFDESFEDRTGISEIDGIKEIELSNWVLPRSGVVFVWDRK